MKLALLVIAVAACSDTAIDRGICGNGIIEPGEDCDSVDGRCSSCGITCVTAEDCLTYGEGTEGFVCGADGFCHAPTGIFEPAGVVAMSSGSYVVTDVDHDGFGDVLAETQVEAEVIFGDATASATEGTSILMPTARGRPAYGDLDTDGSLDLLLPTSDGIAALTSPFGVPSPFPFPSLIDPSMGTPLVLHPAADQEIVAFGEFPGFAGLTFAVLKVGGGTPGIDPTSIASVCGAGIADVAREDITLTNLGLGHVIAAATIRPASGPARLCVLETQRDAGGVYHSAGFAIPNVEPSSRGVFAHLRGPGCPSLVVTGTSNALLELSPQQSSPCRFNAVSSLQGALVGARPVGAVPINPLPGVTAPVALALTTGVSGAVYGLASGNTLQLIHDAGRPLGGIRSVNLDPERGAVLDLVLFGDRATTIDLVYRYGNDFRSERLATEGVVVDLLVGDFDGDTRDDLMFVENLGTDERVSISFNGFDGPQPGRLVGTFQRVLALVPAQIIDSIDEDGSIADVALLFESDQGALLTLLHGSPDKTMLAFFDPRPIPVGPVTEPRSVFRNVVAGRFGGTNGNDIIAFDFKDQVEVWRSLGASGGELMAAQSTTAPELTSCLDETDQFSKFCIEGAHLLAWPDGMRDLVLGIDLRRRMMAFDPEDLVPGGTTMVDGFPDVLVGPPQTGARKAQVIRLDDGSPRLLVAMGAAPGFEAPTAAAINLCTFTPPAAPSCRDLSADVIAFDPDVVVCIDAGYANVAAASRFVAPEHAERELVVLCRRAVGPDMVYRLSIDGSRVSQLFPVDKADALQIGDVTGDGVDDLAIATRGQPTQALRLFRQCTSRDLQCGQLRVPEEQP